MECIPRSPLTSIPPDDIHWDVGEKVSTEKLMCFRRRRQIQAEHKNSEPSQGPDNTCPAGGNEGAMG